MLADTAGRSCCLTQQATALSLVMTPDFQKLGGLAMFILPCSHRFAAVVVLVAFMPWADSNAADSSHWPRFWRGGEGGVDPVDMATDGNDHVIVAANNWT